MVIEVARDLLDLTAASSTEMEPETPDPVVTTMDSQRRFVAGRGDLGGTMRLGAYPAVLAPDSIVADVYGCTEIGRSRHRHLRGQQRLPGPPGRRRPAEVTGHLPDGHLVRLVELDRGLHPTSWPPRPIPSSRSPGRPGLSALRGPDQGRPGATS